METFDFLREVWDTLWGDNLYYLFFFITWMILLFFLKDKYKRAEYVWYSLIVFVGILNPISVVIGEKLWGVSVAYFCRLFSTIQIFVIIAFGCVTVLARMKRSRKPIAMMLIIAIIVLGGDSIYVQPWVIRAENYEKIPKEVIELSNVFEKNGDITIALPNSLSSYFRQYDSSIRMIAGRDSTSRLTLQLESEFPDVEYLMSKSGMEGADFIIVYNKQSVEKKFAEAEYKPWYKTDNYIVYQVSGYDRIKKEYNVWGRVTSVTYLNSDGKVMKNSNGYSIIKYFYNHDENIEYELYYDANGQLVKDMYGCNGYRYEYYKNGKISKKICIDGNLNETSSNLGYVSVTYSYDELLRKQYEFYYQYSGSPFEIDTNVYGYKYNYDYTEDGVIIYRTCLGINGEEVLCLEGYSMKKKVIDNNDVLIGEYYYDRLGQPINTRDGYFGIVYNYNELGQLYEIRFVNINLEVQDSNKGYAVEKRQYDGGKLILRNFFDASGNPVFTSDGYAAVKYEYDSLGNLICRRYLDETGVELWYD